MSTFRLYDLKCPSCAHVWQVEVALGLHITRLPKIREHIKAGTYGVHACPSCKQNAIVENTVVYTDFTKHEYVGVETAATAGWQAAVARHATVFRNALTDGPPIAQELGHLFKKRVVYGFRALREKIVLWDADLDDRVVEAVKGDLLEEEDEHPQDVVLRIAGVLPGGHLMFAMFEPTERHDEATGEGSELTVLGEPIDFVTAPAEMYAARARQQSKIATDYPWLQDEWLVDIHDGPSYLYV